MPHAAVVFLAIVGACSLCFSALVSLSVLALELTRVAGRHLRHGGAPKRGASLAWNLEGVLTTGTTRLSVAYSNSAGLHGAPSVDTPTRLAPDALSRPTGPGYFGPAVGVGDSPGQRRANAT